jgi:pyruvate ferredoxin oxidoreductase delta subunit
MSRPAIQAYKRPVHIDDLPCGTCFTAGHLVDTNAAWRTETPELDLTVCTRCGQCYLLCPEGVISLAGGHVAIDYDFCKGCGICAHECQLGAIRMRKGGL